ncbi:MAG TPA: class I adenylate-forming enzyme family protein [Cytophagaceae bacterium]|nr:class I adenylate-forming enzyme family protein [Cytophagaceae bacterium]
MNIFNIIQEAAHKWGNKAAIHDEYGTLSFSELEREVIQLTSKLKLSGVSDGNSIGVMARNSRQFIVGIFAGLGCGAVVMPLSHQMKKSEIEQIISEAGLHFLIDDKSGQPPLEGVKNELDMTIGSFRFSETGIEKIKPFAPHINNPAFIRFTSGTTGKSKGVVVSHQAVFERIEAANKALNLGVDDTVVWVLPMAYHFMVSIVLYINYGAAIAITKDFLAKTILEYTTKFKGTLLYASPMHIRMLAGDKSDTSLSTLKTVISTSAGISLEACLAFKERFGIDVSQAYGIIEIGLPIINHKKSADHPEAVGQALPDYQVELLDEENNILPFGEIGKLAIKGPGMFDGYLTPPRKKEEILNNGWFMTGDLASKTASGLITIEGREKSMINVSGNKVFPEEVETILNAHSAVEISKIVGNKHPLMGEIVEANVVLKPNAEANADVLMTWCRQRLSAYKVPQVIRFVDSIEMTGSGKVKR